MFNFGITENALSYWVLSHNREAQGLIVDLVDRLIKASISPDQIDDYRLPCSDSIGQSGLDGVLITRQNYLYIPSGKSVWEIGTVKDPQGKATGDYKKRTDANDLNYSEYSFIFVTPFSGQSGSSSWQENDQREWIDEGKKQNIWKDIIVIDGSKLITWLSYMHAVNRWLAKKMGIPVSKIIIPTGDA